MRGDDKPIKIIRVFLDPLSLWLLFIITVGTVVLMLPFSHRGELSFINALFTATSAACVTGLVVKSTGNFFTFWGQIIILSLIQMGALGILTFTSFLYILQKDKLSLVNRSMALNSVSLSDGIHGIVHGYEGVKDLLKKTVLFAVSMEIGGTLLLFVTFYTGQSFWRAMYLSLFHSISAFCNAGFSLFDSSFIRWHAVPLLNITVMALIIAGGIGFPVVMDIVGTLKSRSRISLHTKMAIVVTAVLIFSGTLLFWLLNITAFNRLGLSTSERFWVSMFQSVTARTAGFSTIDINLVSASSLFLLMLLMFIGASPGSTGGGIKTTTIGVLLSSMWSSIKGRDRAVFMGFSIPYVALFRAITIFLLFSLLVISGTLVISAFEPYSLKKIIFEVISAVGTVGLSTGITSGFSWQSKLVLIFLMFIGKAGPFTIAYNLFNKRYVNRVEFPEGKVIVG